MAISGLQSEAPQPTPAGHAHFSPSGHPLAWADGGALNLPADAPSTLTEALLQTAHRFPNHGLRVINTEATDIFRSYAQILEQARRILAGLRRHNLNAGDAVILQVDRLEDHFPAFWGAVLGGMIPVTVAIAGSYQEQNSVVQKLLNIWNLLEAPPVITTRSLRPALNNLQSLIPAMKELQCLAIEDLQTPPPAPDLHQAQPEDVVFFQLTSGSTGIPKCIQETHRGIIAHIHGSQQFNGYSPEDVVLNWLPVDHVVPTLTIHLKDAYLGCQEIHARTAHILEKPVRWLQLMSDHRATHTWAPNFAFKLVSDELARHPKPDLDLSHVKFFMNAGEQVTEPVLRAFLQSVQPFGLKPQAMQPSFGMAEACTCMTYRNDFSFDHSVHRIKKDSLTGFLHPAEAEHDPAIAFVDLGPPIPGVEIRIADEQNRTLPEDKIGRFQIRGQVITPGYLKNPEANSEAFVGDGWFNSGDIGFMHQGSLTLTGRQKEMIIIRGANFYCYEVEDIVNQVDGVEPTFSAACAVQDDASGSEGLAIFFVPRSADSSDWPTLLSKIKQRVASNLGLQPACVIPVPPAEFPKTTSGKIQRTHLKKRFEQGDFEELLQSLREKQTSTATEPATQTEHQLLSIFASVLNLPAASISTTVPFAELGDSLRAAQVTARIRQEFGLEVPLPVLFSERSTVSELAQQLGHPQSSFAAALPPIEPGPAEGIFPPSLQQERLWVADQLKQGTAIYHIGTGIWLSGPLNTRFLHEALQLIAQRHAPLRTLLRSGAATLEQHVLEKPAINLSVLSAASEVEAVELARQEALQPFDMETAPPWRVHLIHVDEEKHLLSVVMHQILTDGWSTNLFVRELASAYRAFLDGTTADLPALPVSYPDYASWQRKVFSPETLDAQAGYWKQALQDMPGELALPTSSGPATDPNAQHAGATASADIPTEIYQKFKGILQARGATPFMGLYAAFKLVLHHFSRQNRFLVGTSAGGRHQLELEPLIGFFVNTVLLPARVTSEQTFSQLLQQAKTATVSAYANQDLPFDQLVSPHGRPSTPNRNPLFQVWFQLNEPLLPAEENGPLRFDPVKLSLPVTQFELTLFCTEQPNHVLHAELEYATHQFNVQHVRQLLSHFQQVLQATAADPNIPVENLLKQLDAAPVHAPHSTSAGKNKFKNLRRKPAPLSKKTT